MAKRLNILSAVLFTWAMVLAPLAHVAAGHADPVNSGCSHGESGSSCPAEAPGHKPHDAAHCAICNLAHAPVLVVASAVLPDQEAAPAAFPAASFAAPAVPAACRLPFSCGPPA